MRLAKLRDTSEFQARRPPRVVRGSPSTPMIFGEHFEMEFQFLIELAVGASWAKDSPNSCGELPKPTGHGLAPGS